MRNLIAVVTMWALAGCGGGEVDCSLVGHVESVYRNDAGEVVSVDAGWSREYADDWNDLHPGVCRPVPDGGLVR